MQSDEERDEWYFKLEIALDELKLIEDCLKSFKSYYSGKCKLEDLVKYDKSCSVEDIICSQLKHEQLLCTNSKDQVVQYTYFLML